MKNKVIFLDWNGTLSNSFFWGHMKSSNDLEEKRLFELWDKALFSKPKEYIQDWMRGNFSTEEVLKEISIETGTEYELILKEFIKGCESMEFVSNEIPSVVKSLQKNEYYVVIATNNMDCFTRWTVPSMQLDKLFDDILNSFYLRGLKHDDNGGESIFFTEFFSKYNIQPKDCVFIDDSIDRDGYITRLGIKYIQIKNSDDLLSILRSF